MHPTRPTVRWTLIFLLTFSLLFGASQAFAHPMGNFSVNQYGKIKVGQRSVEILYLVDMAEIPTYQEMRQSALTSTPDDPDNLRYLTGQGTRLKEGLILEIDGQRLELTTISRQLTFAEGAGGLPTMKLAFVFRGTLGADPGAHKLSYADNNFPGRAGWKEIVIVSDGPAILESTAPNVDRSNELSSYSSDSLNSPPQQLSAFASFQTTAAQNLGEETISMAASRSARTAGADKMQSSAATTGKQNLAATLKATAQTKPRIPVVEAGPASSPSPPLQSRNTPRSRFTELILTQDKLSFWILLSAAFIAAGLGALHALEPGHGKTIVAAYLVGSRGTGKDAVLLGIVVTAAHTAGVYLLGLVTLFASRYIVPEQLYPWLGAISGLCVTGVGVLMFLRHWTGATGEHSHAAGEKHSHWFLSMFKQKAPKQEALQPIETSAASDRTGGDNRAVSLRELCVLGITGGIVPCPAALVVLLSAFSLHRIGFGLFLITAFSLGLAAVLVAVGLTMVYAKRLVAPRVRSQKSVLRYLPRLSSAFMVVLGVGIAASAFASAPIGHSLPAKDKLLPFVTVSLLGLFLGMRHSTDPDHVVAVSTIVSRQRSIRSSAIVGLLWGLGHTLTIFLVGSAIIIFGVVIPPRLGLSMEFCVALMLILLGLLNLTGAMRWITKQFTPGNEVESPMANSVPSRAGEPDVLVSSRVGMLFSRLVGKLGLYQTVRPLAVGLVHGLAGSAAVALLVLSTIKNPFWSTAYLLIFGFGTMAGMMLMTAAISAPLVFAGHRFFSVNRHLTAISGMASVAFGMFLVYHIGFVDGLFSAHVHWVPQ